MIHQYIMTRMGYCNRYMSVICCGTGGGVHAFGVGGGGSIIFQDFGVLMICVCTVE